MADHRAEQIAAAVTTNVTGLATTGTNVFRSRASPIARTALPALIVRLMSEEIVDESVSGLMRRDLTIAIHGYARDASEAVIETKLNLIRKEVAIALQADHMQGLAFVIDTNEATAEYEVTEEGEQTVGLVKTEWVVSYRTSRNDPSA